MNKLVLTVCLIATMSCMVMADLNKTEISDAGKNGVNALNSTLNDFNRTAGAINNKINDFFDISDADTNEKIWKSAVVLAFGAAGFVVGVFGYKLVKPVAFICGFGIGGVFFEAVFTSLINGSAVPIISFILGGIVGGAICYYFYRIGIFVLGAAGGLGLGFALAQLVGASQVVAIIIVVVLAIVGGLLVLYLEKPVMIIATSMYGSSIVIRVIGFFVGNYPQGEDFDNVSDDVKKALWGYFIGFLVVTLIFTVIQYRVTAVGIDHGLGKDDKKDAAKASAAQPRAGTQPVNMV
ncbi:hypothetical protein THRCLA_05028 [Thraustotheca clavata]|uniref:Transmembrane protein 198 n=1 Tax=Thraustotheca clavata TaxID=74557 RepID=A0A1V9ZX66_9STRA|nr:hypothetical protein THRCLA_05028 [Thraustotheca clavata]